MDIRRIGASLMQLPGAIRPMFRSLSISASGLSAQRQRIDMIVSNIANAETTRTPQGGPYQRREAQLAEQVYVPQAGYLEAGRILPVGRAGRRTAAAAGGAGRRCGGDGHCAGPDARTHGL